MTDEQFRRLKLGDLVYHCLGSGPYMVTFNFGERVTAVKTVDMTNPQEWSLGRACPPSEEVRNKSLGDKMLKIFEGQIVSEYFVNDVYLAGSVKKEGSETDALYFECFDDDGEFFGVYAFLDEGVAEIVLRERRIEGKGFDLEKPIDRWHISDFVMQILSDNYEIDRIWGWVVYREIEE
jgi:hypothetical protein